MKKLITPFTIALFVWIFYRIDDNAINSKDLLSMFRYGLIILFAIMGMISIYKIKEAIKK